MPGYAQMNLPVCGLQCPPSLNRTLLNFMGMFSVGQLLVIPTEKADLGSRLPHLQIPAVPRGPLSPLSPFSPSRPGGPSGPLSPFSPVGPRFPAGPRSPRPPILPVGPTLPFNPEMEESCWDHNFCTLIHDRMMAGFFVQFSAISSVSVPHLLNLAIKGTVDRNIKTPRSVNY